MSNQNSAQENIQDTIVTATQNTQNTQDTKEIEQDSSNSLEILENTDSNEYVEMPPTTDIDSDTGEILNAENGENSDEVAFKKVLEVEEVEPLEKTEKELKAEAKRAKAKARKEKIKAKFQPIFKHFLRLKQKKYWVPLVVGHAIMFSCMGYYAYKEVQYAKSTDFIIDSIDNALAKNDLPEFLKVFNVSLTQDRFRKNIKQALEDNPYFARYIGEIADDTTFKNMFEKMLINIVKGINEDPSFNKEFLIFPPDLASQIRKSSFQVNETLSEPDKNIYVIELMLDTIRFGKYPLQLKARYYGDKWSIVDIAGIANIIAQFNDEVKRVHVKKDLYAAEEQTFANAIILDYLPNLSCTASITEISGQDVLIIHTTTSANSMDSDLVSWAVNTQIFLEDNTFVHEQYIKTNGIYKAGTIFSYTENIRLDEENSHKFKAGTLKCSVSPVSINLPKGVFYTYAQ